MFEGDLTTLSTADLLESAAEHRAEARRRDARLLEHALVYADRHRPDACAVRPGRRSCDGRERAVVLGGAGCPPIAEFAVAEFGVVQGISPGVAADFIGQALALRHRFPFTWACVRAGEATPWKACRIVAECSKLSEEAANYVDQRVAPVVDSLTPYRLNKIVTAAKMHADPAAARAEAEEKARERGVFVGRSNDHGTRTMYITAAAGAIARNDATIAAIADALKIFGDTRRVQVRRAEAVGIIADARYTQELLTQARLHRVTHPQPEPAPEPAPTGLARGPGPTGDNPATHSSTNLSADPEAWSGGGDRDPGAAGSGDEDLLADVGGLAGEPCPDDDADRDAPHPGSSDLPDPLDAPFTEAIEPFDPAPCADPDDGGEPLDAAARRALDARLAHIKQDAYTNPATGGADRAGGRGGRVRPGQTEIYVHLTDHTLATGTGVLRAEAIGPLLASQLAELIGYGPYTVKPVIDLNDAVSVDAYEIPDRIRERIKLTHPVELFPYGNRETNRTIDLDHIQPYDPLGPPGQTSTPNLAPLGRFSHRVKTHAHGWNVRRLNHKTLEWTTPHGFTFHVNPTGTHRIKRDELR